MEWNWKIVKDRWEFQDLDLSLTFKTRRVLKYIEERIFEYDLIRLIVVIRKVAITEWELIPN